MTRSIELLCAHSGLAFAGLLGMGAFVVAGWLPPVDPTITALDLAALFENERTRIRIGASILALGSVFWWSFAVAIGQQMKRIEGRSHPLAQLQMLTSTGTAMVVLLASYLWLAIAFRPEVPAGAMQLLNDYAWLMFVGAYPPIVMQNLCVTAAILGRHEQPERPPYPRWAGFVSLWCAILYLPGILIPFFKTGPFAWNDLLAFWMVASVLFLWILVFWRLTVSAIKSDLAGSAVVRRRLPGVNEEYIGGTGEAT